MSPTLTSTSSDSFIELRYVFVGVAGEFEHPLPLQTMPIGFHSIYLVYYSEPACDMALLPVST